MFWWIFQSSSAEKTDKLSRFSILDLLRNLCQMAILFSNFWSFFFWHQKSKSDPPSGFLGANLDNRNQKHFFAFKSSTQSCLSTKFESRWDHFQPVITSQKIENSPHYFSIKIIKHGFSLLKSDDSYYITSKLWLMNYVSYHMTHILWFIYYGL